MLHHVNKRLALDGDDLAVVLHMYLIARNDLGLGVNAVLGKQLDILRQHVLGQRRGRVLEVFKSALFGLCDPRLVIAVAAEKDAAVLFERALNKLVQSTCEVGCFFKLVGENAQRVCDDRVQNRRRAGYGLARAGHAELEFVAGEGNGRGTVAVGGVARNGRQNVNADAQRALALFGVARVVYDGIDYALKLLAEEHRDYRRRRFLRAEAVVIAGKGDRASQKLLIFINTSHECRKEQQKLRVLAGGLARGEQVLARVRAERPVVVLARAVYAGKGLFMQQADKAVAVCDLLHDLHADLVLIVCGVCIGIDRSHFVLSRGDLVMPRFRQNAELPQFLIKVLHVFGNARTDRSEIVILKLLALGRL